MKLFFWENHELCQMQYYEHKQTKNEEDEEELKQKISGRETVALRSTIREFVAI